MNPSPLTPYALNVLKLAQESAAGLHNELKALNTALTTNGTGTVAERLAHVILLDVLQKQQIATDALNELAEAVKE
jgi:hypothetical protein